MGAGPARDVHDPPVPATPNQGQERLANPPGAEQVSIEDCARSRQIHRGRRLGPVSEDGGVVDECVELAELPFHLDGERLHALAVGDVNGPCPNVKSLVRQLPCCGLGLIEVTRRQDDCHPPPRELPGDLEPDAACATRDQRNVSSFGHAYSLALIEQAFRLSPI